MSPQQRTQRRAQRRASWAMVLGVAAIGALILSVWLVGDHAASDVRASEARARAEQAHRADLVRERQLTQLRAGCARGVARDFESLATNRDLRDFARDAAQARRAEGNVRVARRYERTADRAEFRARRIALRLPGDEDAVSVAEFCEGLYPDVRGGG